MKWEKHEMAAIFKSGLIYLIQPLPSLKVMTTDKTKIRLKHFVNCSKNKKTVVTSFCPKL